MLFSNRNDFSFDNDNITATDCTVNISLDALRHNYEVLCDYIHSISPNTALAAVVKADAYGHGADICIPYLYSIGCRNFCVATVREPLYFRICLPIVDINSSATGN